MRRIRESWQSRCLDVYFSNGGAQIVRFCMSIRTEPNVLRYHNSNAIVSFWRYIFSLPFYFFIPSSSYTVSLFFPFLLSAHFRSSGVWNIAFFMCCWLDGGAYQSTWSCVVGRLSRACFSLIGVFGAYFLYIRIYLLTIGHSNVTHSYLIKTEQAPVCQPCNAPWTEQHMLTVCSKYASQRAKCFGNFHSIGYLFTSFSHQTNYRLYRKNRYSS
jgi:hypothetical protein